MILKNTLRENTHTWKVVPAKIAARRKRMRKKRDKGKFQEEKFQVTGNFREKFTGNLGFLLRKFE